MSVSFGQGLGKNALGELINSKVIRVVGSQMPEQLKLSLKRTQTNKLVRRSTYLLERLNMNL